MTATIVSSETAAAGRRMVQSAGNGESHWRIDYLGKRARASDDPEAFLIEMSPNETLLPHFHAVDQFQVFVDGAGTLGRGPALPVTVHYADHHTTYGPIVASAAGLSYFTFRPTTDPGAVYLNRPDARDHLRPSARRHATSARISLAPASRSSGEVEIESLMQQAWCDDGVGAWVVRMGPDARTTGPQRRAAGDRYYLVMSGCIEVEGEPCNRWSIVHVRGDGSPGLTAANAGAEVLLLDFGAHHPATDRFVTTSP